MLWDISFQYFAVVAALGAEGKGNADEGPALKGGGTLEDQIVAANPAMEAFGKFTLMRGSCSVWNLTHLFSGRFKKFSDQAGPKIHSGRTNYWYQNLQS